MKKTKIFLVTVLFLFIGLMGLQKTCEAGDPLSRMLGSDQDVLALVNVKTVSSQELMAEVIYVFPNSKKTPSGSITIKRDQQGYLGENLTYFNYTYNTLDGGGLFLTSLNKDGDQYFVKWGMYEMTGDSYQNAKLISVDFGDMAAIQWFVNTGGQGQFSGEEDKTFVTTADGNKLEIFPNTENLSLANSAQSKNITSSLNTVPFPWIFVVIFLIIPILLFIGLLVGIFYFFWHFRNRPKIYMIGVAVLVLFGLSAAIFAIKLNWRNDYNVRISTCDEHVVTGNILTDGNLGKKVSFKFPTFSKRFGEGVEVQTINTATNQWSVESPTTVCSVLSEHTDVFLETNGLRTITLVKFFDDETLENETSDENTVSESNLEYSTGEDINNDGVIEDIKLYSEKPPTDGLTTLYINQEKIVVPGHNPEGTIKIIDLDTTDGLKEIAVGDLGPSGDPTTSFYDYDGKEILYLGAQYQMFQAT